MPYGGNREAKSSIQSNNVFRTHEACGAILRQVALSQWTMVLKGCLSCIVPSNHNLKVLWGGQQLKSLGLCTNYQTLAVLRNNCPRKSKRTWRPKMARCGTCALVLNQPDSCIFELTCILARLLRCSFPAIDTVRTRTYFPNVKGTLPGHRACPVRSCLFGDFVHAMKKYDLRSGSNKPGLRKSPKISPLIVIAASGVEVQDVPHNTQQRDKTNATYSEQ